MVSRIRLALGVVMLVVTACGMPATPSGDGGSQGPTTPTTVEGSKVGTTLPDPETDAHDDPQMGKKTDFECPVTIPPQPGFVAGEPENVTYSEHFPGPDTWPGEYPDEDAVWYGSEELWTVLAIDGDHSPRKSVWWSINFPGGIVEGEPELWVTWTRLDTEKTVVGDNDGEATNAYTSEEGWFMIAGIDPGEAGCWKVEASYKGASLSYVYEETG